MFTIAATAAAVSILVVMNILCVFAIKYKKNDLADIAWGLLFVIGSFAGLIALGRQGAEPGSRIFLVLLLVTMWGVRLFWHVGVRNLMHKKGEDPRYTKMKEGWGKSWKFQTWLKVFILQSVICFVILSSVLVVISHPDYPLDAAAYVGTAVWIVGFLFESIADKQLEHFKRGRHPKGAIMKTGLWSWSRHPNYFGEVVQWWGIFIFAIPLPAGLWTIVSPLMITWLILKVSGVPLLEEMMKERPGFTEYAKKTPLFFPRPPKAR